MTKLWVQYCDDCGNERIMQYKWTSQQRNSTGKCSACMSTNVRYGAEDIPPWQDLFNEDPKPINEDGVHLPGEMWP